MVHSRRVEDFKESHPNLWKHLSPMFDQFIGQIDGVESRVLEFYLSPRSGRGMICYQATVKRKDIDLTHSWRFWGAGGPRTKTVFIITSKFIKLYGEQSPTPKRWSA